MEAVFRAGKSPCRDRPLPNVFKHWNDQTCLIVGNVIEKLDAFFTISKVLMSLTARCSCAIVLRQSALLSLILLFNQIRKTFCTF
jgi:hypothetical protein